MNLVESHRIEFETGREAMLTKVLQRVNCRYEQALEMYKLDKEDMSYGEAMALQDILFELEDM